MQINDHNSYSGKYSHNKDFDRSPYNSKIIKIGELLMNYIKKNDTNIEEVLTEATKLDVIKHNKAQYEKVFEDIKNMSGLEKAVAENITLTWIKGVNGDWLGGLGSGKAGNKPFEKVMKLGYDIDDIESEFERQMKLYESLDESIIKGNFGFINKKISQNDLLNELNKSENIIGDKESRYVAVAMKDSIARHSYEKVLFTNDLEEAKKFADENSWYRDGDWNYGLPIRYFSVVYDLIDEYPNIIYPENGNELPSWDKKDYKKYTVDESLTEENRTWNISEPSMFSNIKPILEIPKTDKQIIKHKDYGYGYIDKISDNGTIHAKFGDKTYLFDQDAFDKGYIVKINESLTESDNNWDYRKVANNIVSDFEDLYVDGIDYWEASITDDWGTGCDVEVSGLNEYDVELAWLVVRIYGEDDRQGICFRQIDVNKDLRGQGIANVMVETCLDNIDEDKVVLVHMDLSGGFWHHMSKKFPNYQWDDSLKENIESLTEDLDQTETGMSSVLMDLINQEYSLLSQYESAQVTFEDKDENRFNDVFDYIKDDINIHIGMLQASIEDLSPSAEKIDDGKE